MATPHGHAVPDTTLPGLHAAPKCAEPAEPQDFDHIVMGLGFGGTVCASHDILSKWG